MLGFYRFVMGRRETWRQYYATPPYGGALSSMNVVQTNFPVVHRDDRSIAVWSVDERMSDYLGTAKCLTIIGRDPVSQFLL